MPNRIGMICAFGGSCFGEHYIHCMAQHYVSQTKGFEFNRGEWHTVLTVDN